MVASSCSLILKSWILDEPQGLQIAKMRDSCSGDVLIGIRVEAVVEGSVEGAGSSVRLEGHHAVR